MSSAAWVWAVVETSRNSETTSGTWQTARASTPLPPAVDEAMTLKRQIVSELGDAELLLPEQIARALIANDQVKYYFALLQTARLNADRPRIPVPDLKAERLACQLDDAWLDDVVAGTRKDRACGYRIPHGPEILRRISAGVEAMLACLPERKRHPLDARLKRLRLATDRAWRDCRRMHRRDDFGRSQDEAIACISWSWMRIAPSTSCRRRRRTKL